MPLFSLICSVFAARVITVAIKSGWNCYGVAVGVPSTNIVIRNLTVVSPTSAGVCIGSEMSGGVSNVHVSSSTFRNCGTGIRIKSGRPRGGYVKNITYRDIEVIGSNSAAIMINAFYGGAPLGCPLVQKYRVSHREIMIDSG